ncbi:MAG: GTP cyclohydrolase I FolE2 [Candidatus Terraquivivens tikiterensis]|uniref:GTP cyclohydrolase MptA n=1 Tax=Candidatus Terraquivivens tikiterensis TaxID=1980982 RepID=A0A2R7Y1Q8_9ARCH|nr:MAG: GTP cyclohydrolase I FolE2 [Candidatus Terraquivivens tikiterensis]
MLTVKSQLSYPLSAELRMAIPDIKDEQPDVKLPIQMVGIDGVRMPAGHVRLGDLGIFMVSRFGAFIDLPPDRRGVHASRNYEPIVEIVRAYEGKVFRLEDLTAEVAVSLLKKHEYSRRSYVKADATAFYESRMPSGRTSHETFILHARSYATREGDAFSLRKMVGVTVVGMTACPCALEIIKEACRKRLADIDGEPFERVIKGLPIATHTQRCKGTLIVDVSEDSVDVMDLVKIVNDSMSSATYELLKRDDEAEVVMGAVMKPRFVEDVARWIAKGTSELKVRDSCAIFVRVRSMESVHGHDMVASIRTTVGEVRRALAPRWHG